MPVKLLFFNYLQHHIMTGNRCPIVSIAMQTEGAIIPVKNY